MPAIDLITPVSYDSGWPYYVDYDNLPLQYIVARQDLINLAVDAQQVILQDSIGTAGTLSNRLNQSINADGSLISSSIDEALHNIGAHTDGNVDGIDYVRMQLLERSKLELIADNATSLSIQVDSISTTVLFDSGTLEIADSDSVSWNITAPNILQAELAFPSSAAHQHSYGLIPVPVNQMSPDYINYKVTSSSTPFIDESLRIYINGIRINDVNNVFVYNASIGPSGSWNSITYTSDNTDGLFTLSRAIDPTDVILIDFDVSFV